MKVDDHEYYRRRAEVEIERAAASLCPSAVKAHYLLAGHYLDRIYGEAESSGVKDDVASQADSAST